MAKSVRRLGNREDDVELFKRGDARGLLAIQAKSNSRAEYVEALVDRVVLHDLLPNNDLEIANFDDLRDQWFTSPMPAGAGTSDSPRGRGSIGESRYRFIRGR